MRRAASQTTRLTGRHAPLRRALESAEPAMVIAALEPLATEQRRRRLRDVIDARIDAVTVALDAPHDPHNGAAVLRSCDAFGLCDVHVLERRESFMASNAVAKGAERWVEAIGYAHAGQLASSLEQRGYQLVATTPDGELEPGDLRNLERVALVLGNEHEGIGEDLLSACAARVRVPMRGFVESLNLSVTAAILLCFATAGRAGDLSARRREQLYARGLVFSVPRAMRILQAKGIAPPDQGGPGRPGGGR